MISKKHVKHGISRHIKEMTCTVHVLYIVYDHNTWVWLKIKAMDPSAVIRTYGTSELRFFDVSSGPLRRYTKVAWYQWPF